MIARWEMGGFAKGRGIVMRSAGIWGSLLDGSEALTKALLGDGMEMMSGMG